MDKFSFSDNLMSLRNLGPIGLKWNSINGRAPRNYTSALKGKTTNKKIGPSLAILLADNAKLR